MSIDLAVIDLLLSSGQADAALWVLDDQREALRTLASDLDAAVARATSAGSEAGEATPLAPVARRASGPSRVDLVRRAVAVGLAALGLVWIASAHVFRAAPDGQLTGAQQRAAPDELAVARQRLEELQHVPGGVQLLDRSRDLHDRLLSLPESALQRPEVRAEVERILRREQEALGDRLQQPHLRVLVDEIRALRASLLPRADESGAPRLPPVQPPVPAEDVSPRGQTPAESPSRPAPARPGPQPPALPDAAANADADAETLRAHRRPALP
ncbi:MAG: hypothetical protein M3N52_12645 [Actinomycetota bacterium]|nr:hypothetical protein [Actinomycetota bacterium]